MNEHPTTPHDDLTLDLNEARKIQMVVALQKAISTEEEKELDALVAEGQEATLCKAKAILALKHLGIDIVDDLEAKVKAKLR